VHGYVDVERVSKRSSLFKNKVVFHVLAYILATQHVATKDKQLPLTTVEDQQVVKQPARTLNNAGGFRSNRSAGLDI